MRRLPQAIAAVTAACALLPAAAAASGEAVIKDCVAHSGTLTKTYRPADYAAALARLPADALQYTDCADAIAAAARAARLSGARPGSTVATGPTSSWGKANSIPGVPAGTDPLSTIKPAEQAALVQKIASGAAEPVIVGGSPIVPEAAAGALLTRLSRLPAPALVLVITMAVLAIVLAGHLVHRNVRKHRSTD